MSTVLGVKLLSEHHRIRSFAWSGGTVGPSLLRTRRERRDDGREATTSTSRSGGGEWTPRITLESVGLESTVHLSSPKALGPSGLTGVGPCKTRPASRLETTASRREVPWFLPKTGNQTQEMEKLKRLAAELPMEKSEAKKGKLVRRRWMALTSTGVFPDSPRRATFGCSMLYLGTGPELGRAEVWSFSGSFWTRSVFSTTKQINLAIAPQSPKNPPNLFTVGFLIRLFVSCNLDITCPVLQVHPLRATCFRRRRLHLVPVD